MRQNDQLERNCTFRKKAWHSVLCWFVDSRNAPPPPADPPPLPHFYISFSPAITFVSFYAFSRDSPESCCAYYRKLRKWTCSNSLFFFDSKISMLLRDCIINRKFLLLFRVSFKSVFCFFYHVNVIPSSVSRNYIQHRRCSVWDLARNRNSFRGDKLRCNVWMIFTILIEFIQSRLNISSFKSRK